jgi:hypothetical protein
MNNPIVLTSSQIIQPIFNTNGSLPVQGPLKIVNINNFEVLSKVVHLIPINLLSKCILYFGEIHQHGSGIDKFINLCLSINEENQVATIKLLNLME